MFTFSKTLQKALPLSIICSLLLFSSLAQAIGLKQDHIIHVTTIEDELNADGDCSLREAVEAANLDVNVDACSAGENITDVIHFDVDGVFLLDEKLEIIEAMKFIGNGKDLTIIDGDESTSLFHIFDNDEVSFSNMSFQNADSEDEGGAIRHEVSGGAINFYSVNFRNNSSLNGGGALYVVDGSLVIENSSFIENTSILGEGGAISHKEGEIEIIQSEFIQNTSGHSGGAIYKKGDTAYLYDIQFQENESSKSGGAVYLDDSELEMERVSFIENSALVNGGGLFHMGPDGLIRNTTFSQNRANRGGGLYLEAESSIEFTTFYENSATEGSAFLVGGVKAPHLNVFASLFQEQTCLAVELASYSSEGYNLQSGSGCEFGFTGDSMDQDILFKESAENNGGYGFTHVIDLNSPAVDLIENNIGSCGEGSEDQRGAERPDSGTFACDSGAFEVHEVNAQKDSFEVYNKETNVLDILANDKIFEVLDYESFIVESSGAGSLDFDSENGVMLYTPVEDVENFVSNDSFTYSLFNKSGIHSNVATVSIDILSVPESSEDLAYLVSDGLVKIDLLANDIDLDEVLTLSNIVITRPPEHGTLEYDFEKGVITFFPDEGYYGSDSFFYKLVDSDGHESEVSEVELFVSHLLEGNSNQDSTISYEGFSILITEYPSDGELVIDEESGTLIYVPNLNFTGQDFFSYQLIDLEGNIVDEIFTLMDIAPTLDLEVGSAYQSPLPLGTESSIIIREPQNGHFELTEDGGFIYTPDEGFIGIDDVLLVLIDSEGNEREQRLVFYVGEQAQTLEEDELILEISQFVSPASGHSLVILDEPEFGELILDFETSEVFYIPNAGFVGEDHFVIAEVDEQGNVLQSFPLHVSVQDSVSGQAGEASEFPAQIGNTGESIVITILAKNGTVTYDEETQNFVYTANEGFIGLDSFTYAMYDENAFELEEVTVIVEVLGFGAVEVGQTLNLASTLSPLEIENGTRLELLSSPSNGNVLFLEDFSIEYKPSDRFWGIDRFLVQVIDSEGNVLDLIPYEVRVDRALSGTADEPFTTFLFEADLFDEVDEENDDLDGPYTVLVLQSPEFGEYILDSETGVFAYFPQEGFIGIDYFSYQLISKNGVISREIGLSLHVLNEVIVNDELISSGTAAIPPKTQVIEDDFNIFLSSEEDECMVYFNDLETSHWAYNSILELYCEGHVNGFADGSYGVDLNITRAELLKIALLAFEVEVDNEAIAVELIDMSGHWSEAYVASALERRFVEGYTDGTFLPDAAVNRAEALKILLYAASLSEETSEYDEVFIDVKSEDWFAGLVAYGVQENLVEGYSYDSRFRPANQLSRAEASVLIMRIKNHIAE
jgi:CSLREA domain-containing protein